MNGLLTSTDCLDLVTLLDNAAGVAQAIALGQFPLDRYMDLRDRLLAEARGKS